MISIHKALASLDAAFWAIPLLLTYFNPQGSREPRHLSFLQSKI